jgi:hypothetical protein
LLKQGTVSRFTDYSSDNLAYTYVEFKIPGVNRQNNILRLRPEGIHLIKIILLFFCHLDDFAGDFQYRELTGMGVFAETVRRGLEGVRLNAVDDRQAIPAVGGVLKAGGITHAHWPAFPSSEEESSSE